MRKKIYRRIMNYDFFPLAEDEQHAAQRTAAPRFTCDKNKKNKKKMYK